jgi:hypothetical protein
LIPRETVVSSLRFPKGLLPPQFQSFAFVMRIGRPISRLGHQRQIATGNVESALPPISNVFAVSQQNDVAGQQRTQDCGDAAFGSAVSGI